MLYALAASCLKGASERGAGGLITMVWANIATAVGFLVFVPWSAEKWLPDNWWPSFSLAAAFLSGQFCTVFALKWGHASFTTPVMGSKVVMVALLAAVAGTAITVNVWIAAAMTTIGLLVLAWPSQHVPIKRAWRGIALSLMAALSFAVFDIFTQGFSRRPGLSFGLIMPPAMILTALTSAIVLPLMQRPIPAIPRGARRHLYAGVMMLTGQAMLIIWSVGYYGNAAQMNVVYGSRGIWSVVLVWMFGHYFSQAESTRHLPRSLFARRLLGAMLIAGAVVLIMFRD